MIGKVGVVSSGGPESMPQTGPLSDDRDPDDIKLEGERKKPEHWSSPHKYMSGGRSCWCCGTEVTAFVDLPTARYELCRKCALTLESELIGRALAMLKFKIDRELRGDA